MSVRPPPSMITEWRAIGRNRRCGDPLDLVAAHQHVRRRRKSAALAVEDANVLKQCDRATRRSGRTRVLRFLRLTCLGKEQPGVPAIPTLDAASVSASGSSPGRTMRRLNKQLAPLSPGAFAQGSRSSSCSSPACQSTIATCWLAAPRLDAHPRGPGGSRASKSRHAAPLDGSQQDDAAGGPRVLCLVGRRAPTYLLGIARARAVTVLVFSFSV